MKNLIIYYSRRGQNYVSGSVKNLSKGNTELITQYIADAIGADIFEVDTVKPYDADYMVCIEEAKAELRAKARPELKAYLDDISAKKDEVGMVNGLAWTAVGGTLLPLECVVMNGSGKLELTGSLGDVMQESGKAAITAIRTRAEKYHIDPDFYKNRDIHIHALEGAVPKDGPSAGVTMATALYSALTGIPVRADVAMTGEISISGKVLPIGGLKEKSMAAYKAGVQHVIIPKENERDLSEFDPEIRENISYHPVETIDEVIALATVREKKTAAKPKSSRKKAAKTVRSEELGVEVLSKSSFNCDWLTAPMQGSPKKRST